MRKSLLLLTIATAVVFAFVPANASAQDVYQSYTSRSAVGGYNTTTFGSNGTVYHTYTTPSVTGGYNITTFGSSGYTANTYVQPSVTGGYNSTTFTTPAWQSHQVPSYSGYYSGYSSYNRAYTGDMGTYRYWSTR